MNDVVQSHYVGVLQIPQQRHCKQHATFTQNLWGGSLGGILSLSIAGS